MSNSNRVNNRLQFLKESAWLATGLVFLPELLSARIQTTPLGATLSSGSPLTLKIMVPQGATPKELEAGELLQKQLSTLPHSTIELVEETDPQGIFTLFIGHTQESVKNAIDLNSLDEDGFVSIVDKQKILLAGGSGKGLLYAVYDLLRELGFKRYGVEKVQSPKIHTLNLTDRERKINPTIKYRTTSYSQMADQEYSDWQRLSSRNDWGLFVHTFNTLVPSKEHGETHPEYFSLINGVRRPGTQLCLSNPEVLKMLIDSLKARIAEKPEAKYWSVSQDDNDRYCSCEKCVALNTQYGSVPSGSIIWFVNQVARAIPDRIISTLAYWYSRKAPKNIQIEPNVNIMLCNIESSREAPVYITDKAFSNDLRDWGALSKNILIWDYNIQFTNFVSPFPNLFTIKPNIKFYTENHVTALFMQANNEPSAEMALLRSYLIANLMWDPEADEQALINDFLNGYYGAAGKFIRQYIDAMQESLVKSGMRLSIFGDPIEAKESYLSYEMVMRYNQLFDQAEKSAQDDSVLLNRVQTARLPLMYAQIQIGRTEVDTPRSMFYKNAKGLIAVKTSMISLVNTFVSRCQRDHIKLLRERSGTPEHYLSSYQRIFDAVAQVEQYLSHGKKVLSLTPVAQGSKPAASFTDGLFASFESWQNPDQNWIQYSGEHMDVVLDLEKLCPVHSIQLDFLNPQAQPDWHLFSLPKFVSYSFSKNGTDYPETFQLDNPHNPNPIENPDIKSISILPFRKEFQQPIIARYIKIHAENWLRSPAWHIRSGSPFSIYCDQIVVT
jgi:hypothetical protein